MRVIAHELGHVMLHRSSNIYYLKNYTYSNTNKLENEANEFAAIINYW
jgi:Zn-dependent peptidase ImmA (M78 family)